MNWRRDCDRWAKLHDVDNELAAVVERESEEGCWGQSSDPGQGSMVLYEEQRGTVTGELWLGHLPDLTPHSSSGCECESESENSGEAGSERKHASMLGEYDIARAFPTRPN